MKAAQVRDMSADQLSEQLLTLRKQHMDSRFALASGQIKSTAVMRLARRDIARIKTEINVRQKKAPKSETENA